MTKGSPHWSLWWPEQYAHSQMSESYNSICIKYFRQYSMTTDFKQSGRQVMLKLLFSWTTNTCIWQIKVTLLTQTVPLCKMFRPTNSATHIFSTASCSSFQCFYKCCQLVRKLSLQYLYCFTLWYFFPAFIF